MRLDCLRPVRRPTVGNVMAISVHTPCVIKRSPLAFAPISSIRSKKCNAWFSLVKSGERVAFFRNVSANILSSTVWKSLFWSLRVCFFVDSTSFSDRILPFLRHRQERPTPQHHVQVMYDWAFAYSSKIPLLASLPPLCVYVTVTCYTIWRQCVCGIEFCVFFPRRIPQMILKVQLFAKAKELAKGKASIEIRCVSMA